MFDRFTDDARRVVVYAQEECRELHHDQIGTEHLLLGVLHDDTPTGAALGEVGVTLERARDRIVRYHPRSRREPRGHIPLTPPAKRALEESLRHAGPLGEAPITRAHLLLGLLDVRDGTSARTLIYFGVDLDALAARADELLSASNSRTTSGGTDRRLLHRQQGSELGDGVLAARLDDVVTLGNALRRYGRHDQAYDAERGCTCGLQQVLDGLEPPGNG